METIIFVLLVIGEFVLFIWSFKAKTFKRKERSIWKIICFAVLSLLLLLGILKGIGRYVFLIAILFLQASLGLLLEHRGKQKIFGIGRVIVRLLINGMIYLLALLPAFLFPQYRPLPVTGIYEVEEVEFTYVDEKRIETFSDTGENRTVTVKFWYPAQEGDYPLIIFSHGAFGVIDSNYSTCMELASHGYVVASIGHPYHAMFVRDVNGKITIASRKFVEEIYEVNSDEILEGKSYEDKEKTTYLNSQEWLKVRTGDMTFILDTILEKSETTEEVPFSRIDKEKIGLFGHSLGGAASVQLGRERKDIDAVIDLEGSMLGECLGFEDGKEVLNQEPYPIPLLDVNSKKIHDLAEEAPGDGYVNFFVGERALCYQEVIFNDAGHVNFTDLPIVSPPLASLLGVGTVDARECVENVNYVVLTFFDYYLRGEGTLAIEKEY